MPAIRTKAERVTARALIAVPLLALAVFFVWPLWTVMQRGLSWSALRETLGNGRLRGVIWFTVWQASVSTLLTVVVGVGPAVVLARYSVRGRSWLRALSTVPFVLPTVVTGMAFLALLPERWERSLPAILAAHVWVNLAVVIRTVGSALERVDPALEDAAATLGASRWRQLWFVTLPIVRRPISGAAAIVFLFCCTSFGIVRILGTQRHSTIEVEIWRRVSGTLDLATATALSAVQFVVIAIAMVATAARQQTRALHAASVLPAPRSGRRSLEDLRAPGFVVRAVAAVTAAVLLLPLGALAVTSLKVGSRWSLGGWRALRESGDIPGGRPVRDPLGSLGVSLATSVVAAAFALLVGAAAATGIHRAIRRGRVAELAFTVPLGVSAVTVGLGLVITFDEAWYDLRSSWVLLPIGQALIAVPFVLRLALDALRSLHPDQVAAASMLGASPWHAWAAVEWPLLRRALAVAFGFAIAVSLGEFGAASVLSRSGRESAPVAIAKLLSRPSSLNLAEAAALSLLLAILVVVITAGAERTRRRPHAVG